MPLRAGQKLALVFPAYRSQRQAESKRTQFAGSGQSFHVCIVGYQNTSFITDFFVSIEKKTITAVDHAASLPHT